MTLPAAQRLVDVMGTVFTVDIRTPSLTPDGWDPVIDDLEAWWRRVDATFSTYRDDSEISRLDAGSCRLESCAPEVHEALELCEWGRAVSGGYFSATATGRLDPSGVVKGWSVQRASDFLVAAGATEHCINAGGDVCCVGLPEPGRDWSVGVVDPLHRDRLCTVVHGRDFAVATSGTAERGLHVTDPFTGRPVGYFASVTVVTDDLTRADVYATAAMAMGPGAREWLLELPSVEAFAVTADGSAWWTPGYARIGLVPSASAS